MMKQALAKAVNCKKNIYIAGIEYCVKTELNLTKECII